MIEQLEAGVVVRFWSVRWMPSIQRYNGDATLYVGPFWFRTHRSR